MTSYGASKLSESKAGSTAVSSFRDVDTQCMLRYSGVAFLLSLVRATAVFAIGWFAIPAWQRFYVLLLLIDLLVSIPVFATVMATAYKRPRSISKKMSTSAAAIANRVGIVFPLAYLALLTCVMSIFAECPPSCVQCRTLRGLVVVIVSCFTVPASLLHAAATQFMVISETVHEDQSHGAI